MMQDESVEQPADEMRVSDVEVDGQRLHVAVQGSTSRELPYPLLLMNGIGANLELLQPFVDAFGSGIETVRFDVPGTGRSPAPDRPYRLKGLARLTDRLLDQMGYGDVDVLGISWGGGLAQEFAHRYPDRCRRLVLVATSAGAVMVPGRLSALASMANPRRYRDPAYMETIAAHLYGGRIRSKPGLAREFTDEMTAGSDRGYMFQLLAMLGWTSAPWLHRLRQPTLILGGRDDPIVRPCNARFLHLLIPNSELYIYNDGHLGLVTSAHELAPVVRRFLERDTADRVS